MRILTRAEMKAAEDAADATGTSYEQLMENAGTAAAKAIEVLAKKEGFEKTLLLLCGRGNNAGDAFVIARLLAAKGWRVACALLCGRGFSPLAALNFGRMPENIQIIGGPPALYSAAVVADGVFGTGFRGALPVEIAAAFRAANRAETCRVALDIPSGLDCDSGEASPGTFAAHHTLTFGAYKPGLLSGAGPALCGEVSLFNIGL